MGGWVYEEKEWEKGGGRLSCQVSVYAPQKTQKRPRLASLAKSSPPPPPTHTV